MNPAFKLTHCTWKNAHEALTAVRHAVFILEQQVPKALELDEFDCIFHHVLVCNAAGLPIGTGRIGPDGHIGRMAVLQACRGQGVGSALLEALLEYARQQNITAVYLHAQLDAIPFYERHGFNAAGEVFMDAGIAHRNMIRNTRTTHTP